MPNCRELNSVFWQILPPISLYLVPLLNAFDLKKIPLLNKDLDKFLQPIPAVRPPKIRYRRITFSNLKKVLLGPLIDLVWNVAENKLEQLTQEELTKWVVLTLIYQRVTCRSGCPEVFCKKGVLEKFAQFTGKQLCQSLFFHKVAG